MKARAGFLSVLLLAAGALAFGSGDVVVLKGGTRIELKKPAERAGNVVLLTRSDGALLSVPASEIDWKATAAARAVKAPAAPAPAAEMHPETPAEAARTAKDRPKARVKLTDADVSHVTEEAASPEDDKKSQAGSGAARLDVVDYSQEKSGTNVLVRGELRNSGGIPALNSRMVVTVMDEKGEKIASGDAGLSNNLVEPGKSVSFSVTIPVGDKVVASLRFAPQWTAPPAPAAGATPPAAAEAAAAAKPTPPRPTPTPYGQGTLYAPMAAPASTTPPADNHRGYIPGMSSPENQPKPPNQP
jgi:hypothetical protein